MGADAVRPGRRRVLLPGEMEWRRLQSRWCTKQHAGRHYCGKGVGSAHSCAVSVQVGRWATGDGDGMARGVGGQGEESSRRPDVCRRLVTSDRSGVWALAGLLSLNHF